MALISIIIPIYNKERYIKTCLDSILAQSFSDIEIICVDDGSTDSSLDAIREYAQTDNRIIILSKENGGVASARNLGLAYSSAKYIMFSDPDDYYDSFMCEKLYNCIESQNADIAVCEIKVHYYANYLLKSSDDAYYTLSFNGVSENIKGIINNIDLSLCNKIFRHSIINQYNISFATGYIYEDANFCWKYFSVIRRCAFINERLYNYNRRSGSIMNLTFSKDAHAIDHIIIAYDIFKFLINNNIFKKYKSEFADFYISAFYLSKRYSKLRNLPKHYFYNFIYLSVFRIYYRYSFPFKDICLLHKIIHKLKSYI